jgi:hypothetical protein
MGCIDDNKMDDHVVDRAEMYIKQGRNKQVRKTTKDWYLCVEWKYWTSIWERLADLKESNSVEVTEYAVFKNLHDAPVFFWWVPYLLEKNIHSIDDVTKMYHKRTHKFGIEVPKSWDD